MRTIKDYERPDLNIEVTSTLVIESVKYTNLGLYKCATTQVRIGLFELFSLTKFVVDCQSFIFGIVY